MTKWDVDSQAIQRARKILDLKNGVMVAKYDDPDWAGTYWPLHIIWINDTYAMHYLNPNFTIWHELAHALQCERDFNSDWNSWQQATDRYYSPVMDDEGRPTGQDDAWWETYHSIPWEQEADEIARRYFVREPLIR